MNPGDFVVSIAGRSMTTDKGLIPTTKAINLFYTHSQADINMVLLIDHVLENIPLDKLKFELFSVYPTPRGFQIYILMERYVKKVLRNRRPVRIGFLRHLLVGLLYGMMI